MDARRRGPGGVDFHHPLAFWSGVALVILGVVGHIPMYLMGRQNGFVLAGMPMDRPMLFGMASIVAGLAASLYGLYPRGGRSHLTGPRVQVRALDDAPITRTHVGLLIVMAVAVTIDIMKPTTLAFVVPGMTAEYGLQSPLNPSGSVSAGYLPLSGIVGTVIGSFIWGWLGDVIGRRASILYAGITFIATSICGSMPSYGWNLVMCFLMGIGVGGMLPIAYALLAETIPARQRGWLMVLIGADVAGAYILTSWLAVVLIPAFSWRMMWLIGAPTGLLFILLNRWIPESPRYLLATGRKDEAREVMARYGAVIREADVEPAGIPPAASWRQLVRGEGMKTTAVVGLLAVGSGFVLFGFNLWIPTNLRGLGFADADVMLRNASIIGFPFTFAVAWLYGFWSSKKTVMILSLATAIALGGFVAAGDRVVESRVLLYALLVMPIWGINSVVAVLSVYSAEVYPTRIRSRGTGFAAGASKFGGVLIIGLVALGVAVPSISTVALVGAVPMALAALAVAWWGVETRSRTLEEITAAAAVGVAALAPSRSARKRQR